jgi:hypothetical protein
MVAKISTTQSDPGKEIWNGSAIPIKGDIIMMGTVMMRDTQNFCLRFPI